MKTYYRTLAFLVFVLLVLGAEASALLAVNPKEDGAAESGITSEEDMAKDDSLMAGDAISLGCWKVRIHYEIQVKNTGSYKLGEKGDVDGLLTFSGDGTYKLSFDAEGQLQTMQEGAYTTDNKSVVLTPNAGMPWLEGEIGSLGSQKNWTVDIQDMGDLMDTPTKPSRISFAKMNGETGPSSIGPINYKLDSKGATIVIDGHEFSNAEIIFKLKITFEKKKSIKCAKSGDLELNYHWQIAIGDARTIQSRFQIIDFSMFPGSTTDAICKLSGEDPGTAVWKQDIYTPDCETHWVCDIITGIVGKVGNRMSEQCENKLIVDFAETWNCYIASSCMPPTNWSLVAVYSMEFEYRDGYILDIPITSGDGSYRYTLHLNY
jgi:hypothetical protein